MKTIELPIPEGYKAEWVDGVLTLLPEINIGDTVTADRDICFYALDNFHIAKAGTPLKVTGYAKYICTLEHDGAATTADVRCLKPMEEAAPEPQDITERIKTFVDAFDWCYVHDRVPLTEHSILSKECFNTLTPDLTNFLVLRIVVTALNEGWEPKDNDFAYFPIFMNDGHVVIETQSFQEAKMPKRLLFRTRELAEYAATQFRDIYAYFLGFKKGGKK